MNQNKQMIMNYYQNEILDYDKDFYNQYGIYVKPHGYSISSRKIESYIQIAEIQKYLQCNPVKAIDLFFNIELLDGQALLVQRSWVCPNVLAVCTRGYGKSTVIDLEITSLENSLPSESFRKFQILDFNSSGTAKSISPTVGF